jgi:hypothetical protein
MKAALIDSTNRVVNVIVWDDRCIAPSGTIAYVVEDDVDVAPGWTFNSGELTAPPAPPAPPPEPSYLAFWDALIASSVYGSIRAQSMASLPMNTLATEFIALIGDAKAGRPNVAAIQASISAILVTGSFTQDDISEFQNALEFGHLHDIYTLS